MQVSLPIVVALGTAFRNPTRGNWFKSDNVGEFSVDLTSLNEHLRALFVRVQSAGWQVVSVTPITGGVFNWSTHSSDVSNKSFGWGFGWGTSATEGLVVVVARDILHEDVIYLPQVDAALARIEATLQGAIQKRNEMASEIKHLESVPVREVRKGLMMKTAGYGFLENEFSTQAEAEEKKQTMVQSLKRATEEFDQRISNFKIRDHISEVPSEVLDRLTPALPIAAVDQSFARTVGRAIFAASPAN